MNLKVSGARNLKQLKQLDKLQVDFAGLIFENSGMESSDLNSQNIEDSDFDIKLVGEFLNADYDDIMEAVENFNLSIVQLNGDESPFLCEKIAGEIEVIKTIRIESDKPVDYKLADYDEPCDYYLFEPAPNLSDFSLKVFKKSKIEKPFFISGKFVTANLKEILSFSHPDFLGINLSADGGESPSINNLPKLLEFIASLRGKR